MKARGAVGARGRAVPDLDYWIFEATPIRDLSAG